jgi:hypothetical protein
VKEKKMPKKIEITFYPEVWDFLDLASIPRPRLVNSVKGLGILIDVTAPDTAVIRAFDGRTYHLRGDEISLFAAFDIENAGGELPKSYTRYLKKIRREQCKKCGGLTVPGTGRCPCASVKPRYRPAPEGSAEAAHFYQLHKTILSGSWAKTGYRRPVNPDKRERAAQLREGDLHGLEFGYFPIVGYSAANLQMLFHRCKIAVEKSRDSWAGLIGTRMVLWMFKKTHDQVCDILGLTKLELKKLDTMIRRICPFPVRASKYAPIPLEAECFIPARRWKRNTPSSAREVLRRQLHYEQSQLQRNDTLEPFRKRIHTIVRKENECPPPGPSPSAPSNPATI